MFAGRFPAGDTWVTLIKHYEPTIAQHFDLVRDLCAAEILEGRPPRLDSMK